MINLICTHCRAMLEMDDGFAGGACRCQHCGTIQTVPSHLKSKSTGAKKTRTLYQNSPAVPSSGLDQLADVVASSGLSSQRLRTPVASRPDQRAQPQRNFKPLLIGAGGLIVLLCSALVYLVMRDHAVGPIPPANATANIATPAAPIPAKVSPNFCGISLDGDTVVYVLDRGDSTRESFDALKAAAIKSISTLGSTRKFQILFWNNGKDEGYPKNWAIYATPDNINDAQRAIESIGAHGKTNVQSALKNAMSANPTDIVLATGKAFDLDEKFAKTVDAVRGKSNVRIHTLAIGDPQQSTALQNISSRSHGTYKQLSDTELKDYAR